MITFALLIIISGVSLLTMNDENIKQRFMFNAYAISRYREWWRFFTHGALHGDYMHLLFNMISFYYFGSSAEKGLCSYELFGPVMGKVIYLLIFVGALPVSSLYSFFKHKNDSWYDALGASGAVAAVTFTCILLYPTGSLYMLPIPVPIPFWLYGPLYLGVSYYLARRGNTHIGHDAHFWGAIYGFILPILFNPALIGAFVFTLKYHLGGAN